MSDPFEIRTLMSRTAEAVVTNQQLLDQQLGASYLASCQSDVQRTFFSIPRAQVQLRFGVIETAEKSWRLVPFKWLSNPATTVREKMHTHEFAFCVDASPTPPPRVESQNPDPIPLYLSRPYFMLSFAEEKAIKDLLLAALGDENPSWTSAIPAEIGDLPNKVRKEREEFQAAFNDDANEQGPIFFRYSTNPVSYLIVRVVGSSANDSIFVLTPEAVPKVTIYSLKSDSTSKLRYEPLHRLLFTIRRWQSGNLQPQVSNDLEGTNTGSNQPQNALSGLLRFATDIRDGYAAGLKYLAETTSSSAMSIGPEQLTPTTYYDLTQVQASLTYSIGYKEGVERLPFDFSLQRTWGSDETVTGDAPANDARLIESHVYIRAFHEAAKPKVEIELRTPEFVLSDAARDAFIKLALSSRYMIASAFDESDVSYLNFIENETFQRGAVAGLSYRGEEAKHKFLVIWPGLFNGETRDFAFTCSLDKDDLEQFKDIKPVLRVDQDLASVQFEVSGDQYRPFHNFFHAVRMWRVRIKTM
jgi:hypothetical protein